MRRMSRILGGLLLLLLAAAPGWALEAYLPHLTAHEESFWSDYLTADNLGDGTASMMVMLFHEGTQVYQRSFDVPAHGTVQLDITALAPTADCGRVVYASPQLQLRTAYQSLKGGGVAEFRVDSRLTRKMVFLFADAPMVQWKGLAMANMASGVNLVNLKAYGVTGGGFGLLGQTSVSLQPFGHTHGVVEQYFPGIPVVNVRYVVAEAPITALTGITISGEYTYAKLLFTRAMRAEDTAPLSLTSTAFTYGAAIPMTYTCMGSNISPALKVSGVPVETKSLAVVCEDPDAPGGTFIHWILFNLPASTTELPEGLVALPAGALLGTNGFGNMAYNGPCPPAGSNHRYFYRLLALDTMLSLPAGISYGQLAQAVQGHILDSTALMGTFGR